MPSRSSVFCFLPPHVLHQTARVGHRDSRAAVRATLARSQAIEAALTSLPELPALPSPTGGKYRVVYDMRRRPLTELPGRLARGEGDRAVADRAVNQAYANLGYTYDFYHKLFSRNSLDDRGMILVSSVHVGRDFCNAVWDGSQMTFGDGDGYHFHDFTRPLEVVAHELTHGVIGHTSRLLYRGQAGALNESFADVMGSLVKQWHLRQTVRQADWAIGRHLMWHGIRARRIRTLTAALAFENDPILGTDPQPKHMRDFRRGLPPPVAVHVNSGIPNHAFYLAAMALGGRAWEKAGRIWYRAMTTLPRRAGFAAAAELTRRVARREFDRAAERAVGKGWQGVGL